MGSTAGARSAGTSAQPIDSGASRASSPVVTSAAALNGLVGDTDRRCPTVRTHADTLLTLKVLAHGLERGGNHQLGSVELGDVAIPAGRHRGAQATHQVEGSVVLPSGALDEIGRAHV